MLHRFSRWQIDDICLYFTKNLELTFCALCLIGDNLHEISNLFAEKKKEEKYLKMLSAENFTQHSKP